MLNGQSLPEKNHHHHHHHRHRTASPQSPRNKSQPSLPLPPPHHRDGSSGRMSPTTRMFFQAAAVAAAAAAGGNPYESHIRLPQIPHLPPITFNDRNCPSPTPRRKQVRSVYSARFHLSRILAFQQLTNFNSFIRIILKYLYYDIYISFIQARPRRRSGESIGPQDLSKAPSPSNFNNNVAENLSMKKSPNNENINNDNMPTNLSCNNKRPDRTPSPSSNVSSK